MNYIKQLNEFYKNITAEPLTSNAKNLYETLLHINSDSYWREEIIVANTYLILLTGLNISALQRARNTLIQTGYIKYKKGMGNNAGTYTIINLVVQNEEEFEQQTDNKPTINRTTNRQEIEHINKLKETKNISASNSEELKSHFEKIWEIYPNKKGKTKAEELFLQWVKGRKINKTTTKLTDKQMYFAVKKYKKECEERGIEERFIKHGDTFFNKAILDYVEVENE